MLHDIQLGTISKMDTLDKMEKKLNKLRATFRNRRKLSLPQLFSPSHSSRQSLSEEGQAECVTRNYEDSKTVLTKAYFKLIEEEEAEPSENPKKPKGRSNKKELQRNLSCSAENELLGSSSSDWNSLSANYPEISFKRNTTGVSRSAESSIKLSNSCESKSCESTLKRTTEKPVMKLRRGMSITFGNTGVPRKVPVKKMRFDSFDISTTTTTTTLCTTDFIKRRRCRFSFDSDKDTSCYINPNEPLESHIDETSFQIPKIHSRLVATVSSPGGTICKTLLLSPDDENLPIGKKGNIYLLIL